MKRFTINGLNMLESFFAIYWGKMREFSENIGFDSRGR